MTWWMSLIVILAFCAWATLIELWFVGYEVRKVYRGEGKKDRGE